MENCKQISGLRDGVLRGQAVPGLLKSWEKGGQVSAGLIAGHANNYEQSHEELIES